MMRWLLNLLAGLFGGNRPTDGAPIDLLALRRVAGNNPGAILHLETLASLANLTAVTSPTMRQMDADEVFTILEENGFTGGKFVLLCRLFGENHLHVWLILQALRDDQFGVCRDSLEACMAIQHHIFDLEAIKAYVQHGAV